MNDPTTGAAFPNNTIPVSRIDPAAAKILGVLPTPNSTGTFNAANGLAVNNLVEVGSTKPSSNNITTRVDHNFSENDRTYVTFTHFNSSSPQAAAIKVRRR